MKYFSKYLFILLLLHTQKVLLAESIYWLQFMPDQEIWFRVVTDQEECPKVNINDTDRKMSIYSNRHENMKNISCMLALNGDAVLNSVESIEFEGKKINFTRKPQKIAIIGDTGCRLKGIYLQDCQKNWPFKQVIDIAATHKPDLVIHVGDYFYREFCLSNSCKNEPTGDTTETWNREFFIPAKQLLKSAPWIMVRGNHESCSRGGNGWSHFFDYRNQCEKNTPTYTIDISSDLRLIIADSASAVLSQKDIDEINKLSEGKRSWLLTHRPLWHSRNNKIKTETKPNLIADNINSIFSGHIHIFQRSENIGKQQFIIGNSGTKLDKIPDNSTKEGFGFTIISRQANNNWKLESFNTQHKIIDSHIIE